VFDKPFKDLFFGNFILKIYQTKFKKQYISGDFVLGLFPFFMKEGVDWRSETTTRRGSCE
jgi:hypothetical protein